MIVLETFRLLVDMFPRTHDREVANICDRIINIVDGVIVNDN